MTDDDRETPDLSWEEQVARMPGLLRLDEAATILRMHPTTVRGLAHNQDIPATKLGTAARGEWRLPKRGLLTTLQVEIDDTDALLAWEKDLAQRPELLKITEAAAILRMHPTTVRGLAASGEIPATKLGAGRGEWRVRKRPLLTKLHVTLGESGS